MKIAYTYNLRTSTSEEQSKFDRPETVALICEALTLAGHRVEPIEVSGPVARTISRLESFNPDLVFNTAEGRAGRAREAFFPSMFEGLGLPFVGSDAYVCALTLDKNLSRALVSQQGILTPRWKLVLPTTPLEESDFQFPVVCKAKIETSAFGTTQESIYANFNEISKVFPELLRRFPLGILVEENIVGQDLEVGFIEGVSGLSSGVLQPSTSDPKVRHLAMTMANQCIRVLGIRDFGSLNFRLTSDGKLYFLAGNTNPTLELGATFYDSAQSAGLATPTQMLAAIIENAAFRYGLTPQTRKRSTNTKRKVCVGFAYNLRRIHSSFENDVDAEAEFDTPETVGAIREAIASLGYDVVDLEANAELPSILPTAKVDVVFNIAEGIGGRARESLVPALLDLMQIPYTGSDVTSISICHDKILAKRVVSQAGIATAPYFSLVTGREKIPKSMEFPLIVKPANEGSSKGIHDSSVVLNEAQLRAQATQYLSRYHQPLLVETYLPGREFTVGLLGEKRPQVLPIMEVIFTDKSREHPVYSFESKVNDVKVKFEVPAKIDAQLQKKLATMARQVFTALGCRDFARIDFRLDEKGNPLFLECNPLPGLTPNFSDLCVVAAAAGLDYRGLISEILGPALRRMRVQQAQ